MYMLDSGPLLGENPYWVFISFLYAGVATEIAGCFSGGSYGWQEYRKYIPIYSHLTLAAFVVGTSWLGLTRALAALQDCVNPRWGIIAPVWLLLIVDFSILGVYFAFVRVVNKARSSGSGQKEDAFSTHASFWMLIVLSLYCVWDGMVYFLFPKWPGPWHSACTKGGSFCARSWMSVFCLALALLVFLALRHIRSDCPFWVLPTADVSLIFFLLFYRALKQLAGDQPREVLSQMVQLVCPFLTGNGTIWCARAFFGVFFLLALVASISGRTRNNE